MRMDPGESNRTWCALAAILGLLAAWSPGRESKPVLREGPGEERAPAPQPRLRLRSRGTGFASQGASWSGAPVLRSEVRPPGDGAPGNRPGTTGAGLYSAFERDYGTGPITRWGDVYLPFAPEVASRELNGPGEDLILHRERGPLRFDGGRWVPAARSGGGGP